MTDCSRDHSKSLTVNLHAVVQNAYLAKIVPLGSMLKGSREKLEQFALQSEAAFANQLLPFFLMVNQGKQTEPPYIKTHPDAFLLLLGYTNNDVQLLNKLMDANGHKLGDAASCYRVIKKRYYEIFWYKPVARPQLFLSHGITRDGLVWAAKALLFWKISMSCSDISPWQLMPPCLACALPTPNVCEGCQKFLCTKCKDSLHACQTCNRCGFCPCCNR